MSELLRIGALTRLDEHEPEHVREFASSACERTSIEPDEIASLLAEYEDGRWRLVRLDLFADVVGPEGRLRRVDSVHVDGVWFTAPHGRDNVRHAQEATDQSLERLHDHLAQSARRSRSSSSSVPSSRSSWTTQCAGRSTPE